MSASIKFPPSVTNMSVSVQISYFSKAFVRGTITISIFTFHSNVNFLRTAVVDWQVSFQG